MRTDFGSGGDGRQGRRRGSSGRNHQGAGDDSANPSPSSRGDRRKLSLLVELTCVVQTAKDGAADHYGDGGRRGGEGVRGPLKNFRVGSSSWGGRGGGRKGGRRRVGGIRAKDGGRDGASDSYDSDEGSSSPDDRSSGSQVRHLIDATAVRNKARLLRRLSFDCACVSGGRFRRWKSLWTIMTSLS